MGRSFEPDIPLESLDRPPSYNDVTDASSFTPVGSSIPGSWNVNSGTATLSPSFTESPHQLYRLIVEQARLPPQQHVRIRGFKGKGDRPKDREKDFDFSIDLTPTLLRVFEDNSEWHELRVVRDGDGQKVFRGGNIKSVIWEQPSCPKKLRETTDLEDGNEGLEDQSLLGAGVDGSNESTPTLMGWCERFCRDPATLKSFTFTREIKEFDSDLLCYELKSYLRSINYHGHIKITVSFPNKFITVYSPHWINRLRHNSFIWLLCVLLQLWIVTLPAILILESRYDVASSVWMSSREVEDSTAPSRRKRVYAYGRNEEKLADLWAPAVLQAACDQRVGGELLGEQHLSRLQRRAQERQERMEQIGWLASREPNIMAVGPSLEGTQDDSWCGPAVPGVGIRGYNVQGGWGGNS